MMSLAKINEGYGAASFDLTNSTNGRATYRARQTRFYGTEVVA